MGAALTLASRAVGTTYPNPPVGCIIIKDNIMIARGWTQPSGRPHAEAMALSCINAAGAAAYITLEPCAHQSPRGPDCAGLLIESGIKTAIIAAPDPDPRTNGKGIAKLQAAGIKVITGIRTAEAQAVMAGFLTRQHQNRPHITLKLALSLDGCLALNNGTSRWITSPRARAHAHLERARADIILIGTGTYVADHPRLDVRLPGLESRSPTPALLGKSAAPKGWLHVKSLEDMASLPANEILVEGGAKVAASLLAADMVDRLLIYRAPLLLGGQPGIAMLNLTEITHNKWHPSPIITLGPDRLEIFTRNR